MTKIPDVHLYILIKSHPVVYGKVQYSKNISNIIKTEVSVQRNVIQRNPKQWKI